MDSNFEVIKSIYENECQRILECKEIKTGENFIYNIIYNSKLMKLIDVNALNSINSNIVKCQKTQDRLYIVTKPHELTNQKLLKDYINNNNLTLKQQFSLTEQLINLFLQIYNTTDLLQYKILSFDNLSIDKDNVLFVNGYFEFTDEYDLSDNYSYKNVGQIIHYIFAREEIVDYNISDTIPPDVLKIIVKCLTREYFHPKDTLKELENSPIYGLINCKTDSFVIDKKMLDNENYKELSAKIINDEQIEDEMLEKTDSLPVNNSLDKESIGIVNKYDTNDVNDVNDLNEVLINEYEDIPSDNESVTTDFSPDNEEEDDSNVIDIFLSDAVVNRNEAMQSSEKNDKVKKIMKYAIPAIMVVFIVVVGIFVIKSLFGKSEPTSGDNIDNGSNVGKVDDNKPGDKDNTDDKDKTDNNSSNDDKPNVNPDTNDFKMYFNDDLIKKIGYTGKLATVSTEVYSTGNSSLLVENDSTETAKILFAVVDFTNEKLSYMLNDTVAISAKFKAYKDLDAKLVVEVYKNNKILSNKSAKISIQDDIWIQKEVTIETEKIDRVNLYLEFTGKNKIWIDNISVDVMK